MAQVIKTEVFLFLLLLTRYARPCWSRPPSRVGLCTRSKITGFALSVLLILQLHQYLTVLPEAYHYWFY